MRLGEWWASFIKDPDGDPQENWQEGWDEELNLSLPDDDLDPDDVDLD